MDRRPWPHRLVWAVLAIAALSATARSAPPGSDAAKADVERDRAVVDRFLALLERNPRRGTALDRVYGYHVEQGTLDTLLGRYRARVERDPNDGAAWLLLGLIESQRGRDAASVTALRKAESTRASDPLPSYYLGQALVLVGQPDAAAEAFERAIARKPARADLLDIFQALARVHQRAQRLDKALEVWSRLEKQFPDDIHVQEQVAAALAEESKPEAALARYEALARKVKDDYRRVLFRLEAGDLKVRMKRTSEALQDFEQLLGGLNPESWLGREVRRRIDDVFLRNDDLVGLARYYTAWLEKNPEDVEAMARLGRTLANDGHVPEARAWLEKAVKRAPSRRDLRLALIEQLTLEHKFTEASAQFEAMARTDPTNPDTLRAWGRLLLRDDSRPEAARKAAAAAVWKRIVDAKPDDPSTAVQVADLLRQSGLNDEALALYRKATELAPKGTQYSEYLGEFYHALRRPEDAKRAWASIASGENRTAQNLARLSEVLAGFGYKAEAIEPIAAACALGDDEIGLRMQYARLLHETERFADERAQLDVAAKLAEGDDEAEAVLAAQVENLLAARSLGKAADELRAALEANQDATAARWRRLARYYEADQRLPEATIAIRRALAIEPRSVPTLTAAARIVEQAGDLGGAAELLRTLTEVDRRARADYFTRIAKLQARLGRRAQALQAGRDLLAAAPGSPTHYQFFAELCFQLGDMDQGLDALRRSVRVNPNDAQVLLTLGEVLARQFRTDEAIEIFWRAFDKAANIDAKLGIVARLADLYLQRNQFERMTARLERGQRESETQREMTICLAAAYQAAGDLGTARQTLEPVAAANPRDSAVLGQLCALAELEGDFTAAARYQRQLNDANPTEEGASRLADLLVKAGDTDQAETIWEQLATANRSPHRTLQALDSLIANGKYESVLPIADRLARQSTGQWEALYREAVALIGLERTSEARQKLRALLALQVDDDEKSAIAIASAATAGPSQGAVMPGPNVTVHSPITIESRVRTTYQIRNATSLEARPEYSQARFAWVPDDFGQARMACLGMLFSLAQRDGTNEEFVRAVREAAEKAPAADARPRWDWYYLSLIRGEQRDTLRAARHLARHLPRDPAAQWALLEAIAERDAAQPGWAGPSPMAFAKANMSTGTRLSDADLGALLTAFETLRKLRPEWTQSSMFSVVAGALKRAKKTEQEERFYRDVMATAADAESLASVLAFAAERNVGVDEILTLFDRYRKAAGHHGAVITAMTESGSDPLVAAMCARADAKAPADVLRIVDHYLAAVCQDHDASRRRGSVTVWAPSNRQPNSAGEVSIKLGKNWSTTSFDFPGPNSYFDQGALQILREAFELFKRDDVLTDLFAHFRARAEKSVQSERVQALLALAYLRWWNDEKDEAVRWHDQACAASGNDLNLRLELADLHEERGDPSKALATADSIEPLDQGSLLRREQMALRLAAETGNIDRARKASERLFGLRLDSETLIALAAQMHQLGMHELGEAVLTRVRRRAGQQSMSLFALMQHYQSLGKTDQAVEIAHLLLRKPQRPSVGPGRDQQEDAFRQAAVQVLAQSGRLKEMIARAEVQHRALPRSTAALQTLITYYQAENQNEKVRALLEQMAAIRPDDVDVQLHVGQQLIQIGAASAALDCFARAVRKDPGVLARHYGNLVAAYTGAEKLDELIALYETVDLRRTGNPIGVIELVQLALQDKALKRKERGISLFRKAWQTFPAYRPFLLGSLHSAELWKLAEIYGFARDAVVPTTDDPDRDPWTGFQEVIHDRQSGGQESLISRLVSIAVKQEKLERLERDIDAACSRSPGWVGGRALLAIIKARRGRTIEAASLFKSLMAPGSPAIPSAPSARIADEIKGIVPLTEVRIALLQNALVDDSEERTDENGNLDGSAFQALFGLYRDSDRVDEARALIDRQVARLGLDTGDVASLSRLDPTQANSAFSLSQYYLQLGDYAQMVRLFAAAVAANPAVTDMMQWGRFGGMGGLRSGSDPSLAYATPTTAAETLRKLLARPVGRPGAGPSVDLVLVVYPHDFEQCKLIGVVDGALEALRGDRELLAETSALIDRAVSARPDDLSAHTAAALAAIAGGNADKIAIALERLLKVVDSTPLDVIPAGGRANARQRVEALRQIGLWHVARACWARDATRAAGDRLAGRALEAARRQTDPLWLTALLRDKFESALRRGDRAIAEDALASLFDQAFEDYRDGAEPKNPDGAGPPAAGRATAAKPPAPETVTPISLDRFQRVAAIATLASQRAFHEASLRAIQRALRNGQPVNGPGDGFSSGMSGSRGMPGGGLGAPDQQVAAQIGYSLASLELLWREDGAPAPLVYATLRDAVLPDARPAEVFLCEHMFGRRTAAGATTNETQSVAELLAYWAVRAGMVDDLRRRSAARLDRPTAQLHAHALLAHLARETGNATEAEAHFGALTERLKHDSQDATAAVAYHAALLALSTPAARKPARALFEATIENLAKLQLQVDADQVSEPSIVLVRSDFDAGDRTHGLKQIRQVLENQERLLRIQGTDPRQAAWQRANLLVRCAAECARAGLWSEVMEMLGQSADLRVEHSLTAVIDESNVSVLVLLSRELRTRTPADRYALLKAWTWPAGDRKDARLIAAFIEPQAPVPDAFATRDVLPTDADLYSTATWLIDAAHTAGTLDDLAKTLAKADRDRAARKPAPKAKDAVAKPAREKKPEETLDNLSALRILVAIEQGRAEDVRPALERRIASSMRLSGGNEQDDDSPGPVAWPDYLVTRAALGVPELADVSARLAAILIACEAGSQQSGNGLFFGHRLQLDPARIAMARLGSGSLPGREPDLALWQPTSIPNEMQQPAFGNRPVTVAANILAPGWWVEHKGLLVHIGGPGEQYLVGSVPLTGRFEVTVQSFADHGISGLLGYGGLLMQPGMAYRAPGWQESYLQGLSPNVLWTSGQHEILRPKGRFAGSESFNTLTLHVEPGTVRYLVNGHLCYEDTDPSPTAPWLVLGGRGSTPAVFRNMSITGNPEVPRTVRLVHRNRLDGWAANFYHESIPARRRTEPSIMRSDDDDTPEPRAETPDWWAQGGEIHGRARPPLRRGLIQSRLAYQRPLRDGESVSYEFYYEPDRIHVHPAVGRLAFLIEPGGVRLHWMTDALTQELGGPKDDNVADDPAYRTDAVVLKPGAWNLARVGLESGKVSLEINGKRAMVRPLEPTNDRTFSLYHDKARTSVRVRDVVLTGAWPSTLSPAQRAEPLARGGPAGSAAEQRARLTALGDRSLRLAAADILAQTRQLPLRDRYQSLLEWVVPSASNPDFRLFGTLIAAGGNPSTISPYAGFAGETPTEGTGTLESPALDLIESAKRLGKLDELADRVARADGADRARVALIAMIRAEQERDADALVALQRLKTLVEQTFETDAEWTRWPELLAASRTAVRPALRKAAIAILDLLANDEPIEAASGTESPADSVVLSVLGQRSPGHRRRPTDEHEVSAWQRHVVRQRALARQLDTAVAPGQSAARRGSSLWLPLSRATARSRGTGCPPANWLEHDGTWTHVPGHRSDMLYFQIPLGGDFEVAFDLSASAGHKAYLVYGGIGFGIKPGGTTYEVIQTFAGAVEGPIDPSLAAIKDWYNCRCVVQSGTLAYYANGRKLYEQILPREADPWLRVASNAVEQGTIRGVTIKGRPTIPDRLALSGEGGLDRWTGGFYNDPLSGTDAAWGSRRGELIGRLADALRGCDQERLLQYHRPLAEDGAIELEFFHDPGRVMVHPAIGRVAFLIEPGGVKVHQLTDSPREHRGMTPGNASIEPDHRRGPAKLPLKVREWNHLRVALNGNLASLTLNGTLIYERPVERTDQRFFGLFHYAGETEARVRNVTYQGRWPKSLPDAVAASH
jgi:tetratricopeptide (TPR) repeat protein